MTDWDSIMKAPWLPIVTGLAGWAGGFFTDIGKEHFSRKIRLREEHAQDILKEVLTPIYEYLKEFYLPVCQLKFSPLEVGRESIHRTPDHITQDTYVRTEYRVSIKVPAKSSQSPLLQDQYWHETEGFRRYFDDAIQCHYPDLLARWRTFDKKYKTMAGMAKNHAEALIPKIQQTAGLPPLMSMGPDPATWANYPRLAVLVLNRRLGMNEEGLYFPGDNKMEVKTRRTQEQVLKCASPAQADQTVAAIDQSAKESAGIEEIKTLCSQLQEDAAKLIEDFRFELAKKPALRKCPLV